MKVRTKDTAGATTAPPRAPRSSIRQRLRNFRLRGDAKLLANGRERRMGRGVKRLYKHLRRNPDALENFGPQEMETCVNGLVAILREEQLPLHTYRHTITRARYLQGERKIRALAILLSQPMWEAAETAITAVRTLEQPNAERVCGALDLRTKLVELREEVKEVAARCVTAIGNSILVSSKPSTPPPTGGAAVRLGIQDQTLQIEFETLRRLAECGIPEMQVIAIVNLVNVVEKVETNNVLRTAGFAGKLKDSILGSDGIITQARINIKQLTNTDLLILERAYSDLQELGTSAVEIERRNRRTEALE